eukprot:g16288.t1
MGAYGCPGASWARSLLLAVFLRAFSAVASSKFLAPTTEPPVEQAADAVAEPVTRALSSGRIAHEIGKHVLSLREVGQLRRVSVATRTWEPTAEQVVRGIHSGKFKAWSHLDRVPDRVRHSPVVLKPAMGWKLLRSRSEWEQLPAATRRLEVIVIFAIQKKILTDWTNAEDFPEDVRAIPGVVRVAIHNSVLTTRAQWDQLPPGVRQDTGVLQALLMEQPFRLDWDDRGVFPEEVRAMLAVVVPAINVLTRTQWDQLPGAFRQDGDVLRMAMKVGLLTDWEDRNAFPDGVRVRREVVVEAIRHGLLRRRAQWEQLPEDLRRDWLVKETANGRLSSDH